MDYYPRDFESLHHRVVRLENQNRRLKQLGITALFGAALFLLMGQAPTKKTVEANEFILKDSTGKVRARLGMNETFAYPEMRLVDSKGQARIDLFASDYNGGVEFFSSADKLRLELAATETGSGLYLNDSEGKMRGSVRQLDGLFDGGVYLDLPSGKGGLLLSAKSLDMADSDGFEAVLGSADLVTPSTGETHKTSAASLVMFDKGKNLIWKAP
jgi:hypothetical protein